METDKRAHHVSLANFTHLFVCVRNCRLLLFMLLSDDREILNMCSIAQSIVKNDLSLKLWISINFFYPNRGYMFGYISFYRFVTIATLLNHD